MIILGIIALVVIPPEKLPEVARQLARFINDLRRSTSGIWDDLKHDVKQNANIKPENSVHKTVDENKNNSDTEIVNPEIKHETKPHE